MHGTSAEEGQKLLGVVSQVGTFREKLGFDDDYVLTLVDKDGFELGMLYVDPSMHNQIPRFHSRHYVMHIWNLSPDTAVIDTLVRAAHAVAEADGGAIGDQPVHVASESVDPLLDVTIAFLVLALLVAFVRRGSVSLDFRAPHVIQVVAQGSIFLYWMLYWPGVKDHLPSLAVQLLLAYAADATFCFLRFGSWRVGLSPIPVTFSVNLFEWFDWHALAIALPMAFFAKAYIHRGGRHIFNPSVAGLTVVGLISIVAPNFVHFGSAFHTLNLAPNMAEWVLLAALLPQLRYRIIPLSIAAILAIHATGTPSIVRPSILLGFTLLACDPATTPRTDFGKVLFGVTVGLGLPVLSVVMRHIGQPDDFAKVMSVAVANLLAPEMDRLVGVVGGLVTRGRDFAARLWPALAPTARFGNFIRRPIPNLLMVACWLVLCFSWLQREKREDFEASLHWNWGTPLIVRDADDVPRCDHNPVFCQPFSFGQEAMLWLRREGLTGGPARRDAVAQAAVQLTAAAH